MRSNNQPLIKSFTDNLFRDYFIMAPVYVDGRLLVAEAKTVGEVDWSGQLTENPWKEALLPQTEKLFDLNKDKLEPVYNSGKQPPVACLGMNILDLKALTLYDLVFSNDIYYQNRLKKLMIIGFSHDWPGAYKKLKLFSHNFEQDVLEHVIFDIFIAQLKNGKIKFYSGSDKGRELLERYGVNDFDNIQFAGAIPEEGPDKRMTALQIKVEKSSNHSLWNNLDKICLACGKCTIACPTCFCFDFRDKIDPANARRDRVQGNCFYNDFSKVAGGHRELDTVKKKIYFWYFHKFVRIPREYEMPGCVSCGRCVKTCPVGIDIFKNTALLMKQK